MSDHTEDGEMSWADAQAENSCEICGPAGFGYAECECPDPPLVTDEAVEKAAKAMSAADDATFDPDCPSPCFPVLARAALEAAAPLLVAAEREAREKAEGRWRQAADQEGVLGRELIGARRRLAELEAERLTPEEAGAVLRYERDEPTTGVEFESAVSGYAKLRARAAQKEGAA